MPTDDKIVYRVVVYPDRPALEKKNGDVAYYFEGKLHRDDGPAVICADSLVAYYKHGKLHCEDGPAIISSSGKKQWFLNGKQLTEQEFLFYKTFSFWFPKFFTL